MAKTDKLTSALLQGVVDCNLGLVTALENTKFNKPTGATPWAAVFILYNPPFVATLGHEGEDGHDGVLQIDLNYPLGNGEGAVRAKADAVAEFFFAGRRLPHQGVFATVTSCGRSRGREVDGWYRVSMSVVWSARIPRNP